MKTFKTVLFAAVFALCQAAVGAEGDLLDASEVFDIGDGRYLIVEG